MFGETIAKLADVGAAKAAFLRRNPAGFLTASAMAGIYVGFAILMIFSMGSLIDPSLRPLVMGAPFGLALILVVFAGAELYTGLTMSMTMALLERRTALRDLAAVWLTSWVGNLLGALLLAGLFVMAGGGNIVGAPSELIYGVAGAKMNAPAVQLVFRAILCNWLVCLAIWMAMRIASESGRMIAIAWCLFAFVASGYEHSVANMTIFGVALLSPHPDTVSWAGAAYNLFWVTIGNTIAGALFMAGAYRFADVSPAPRPIASAQPAE